MGVRDKVAPTRRVRFGFGTAIAVMLLCNVAAVAQERTTEAEVVWTMVDVTDGTIQGDGHLIEAPGRTMLIDAGTYELGRSRLVPHLRRKQIDRLHIVFVSHMHRDHYGGVRALIEAGIAIDRVAVSLPEPEICRREVPWGCSEDDVQRFISMLDEAHIPVEEPEAPHTWPIGEDASLTLLQRLDADDPRAGTIDVNDSSMVLRLDVGATSVLFTGDLNRVSGAYLTSRDLGLGDTVFLKVPHHGTESLPADDFFAAVDPDFALVPAPASLWRSQRSSRPRRWFEEHHVPTFVSGEVGDVTVHLGGHLRVDIER